MTVNLILTVTRTSDPKTGLCWKVTASIIKDKYTIEYYFS